MGHPLDAGRHSSRKQKTVRLGGDSSQCRRDFMKRVKAVGAFVIYELNKREQEEYGFAYAPVLKESVEAYGRVCPSDADIECETLELAISWAQNY